MRIQKRKRSTFSVIMAFAMMILLVFPTMAFADGEDTPAAEETTEQLAGEESSAEEAPGAGEETEEPAAEEPLVEETPVTEETTEETAVEEPVVEKTTEEPTAEEPIVEEAPADEETTEESTTEEPVVEDDLGEIVAALSEADVVLVDEGGEVIPLASEEAAEVLAAPDPYIVRGGTTYQFVTDCTPFGGPSATCDESANPIQAALDFAIAGEVIVIEAGTAPEDIIVSTNNLTLQRDTVDINMTSITLNALNLSTVGILTNLVFVTDNGTIQNGIDVVSIGGTVNVAAGEYNEYLHITKDGVTVQGAGIDQSIIDLDGLEPAWHYTGGSYASRSGVEITAYGNSDPGHNMTGGDTELIEDVTFSGFTVKNAGVNAIVTPQYYDQDGDGTEDVHGINVGSGKNVTINNCEVELSGDVGISFGRARKTDAGTRPPSENPTVTNCIVSSNHDTGINVSNSIGIVTISGNTVTNNLNPANLENHAKGICVAGRSNSLLLGGTINNNIVSGNIYYGIEAYRYTDGITIENNTVTGHNLHEDAAGIFLSTGWGTSKTCKNHTVQNNIVTGNIRGIIAYFAWGDNPGDLLISGNTISTDSGAFLPEQAAIKIDNAYNITIQDNTISCDGPGIRILTSASHDNLITENTITNASIAGIMIDSGAYDNTFTNNRITNTIMGTKYEGAPYKIFRGDGVFLWGDEVNAPGSSAGSNNVVHNNSIYGNATSGMENQTTWIVDATNNWWGAASGPTHALNPAGTGDAVSDNVTYFPWLGTDPYPLPAPPAAPPVAPPAGGAGMTIGFGPGPFAGLIPVTGAGELVELSCEYANTLELPSGDSIIFDSVLCGYFAELVTETEETLPVDLPDGSDFVAGLTLNLLLDGELVDGETLTISFAIPEGMEGSNFAILAWDADTNSWVEVGGVTVADGFVTVTVNYPGTFVLVAR